MPHGRLQVLLRVDDVEVLLAFLSLYTASHERALVVLDHLYDLIVC